VDARQDLDERRFAGAIVSQQAQHLAHPDIERNVVRNVDRSEGLVDVDELENGCHSVAHFFFGL
jgi:hypothetical protein